MNNVFLIQKFVRRIYFHKKVRISLIIIVVGILFYLLPQPSFSRDKVLSVNTPEQTFSQSTLNALGYQVISSNQYAIGVNSFGESTGEAIKQNLVVGDGQYLTFETDKTTSLSLIQGSKDTVNYVKGVDGFQIYQKTETFDLSGKKIHKIDTDIEKKLETDNTAPVIIQFNLPFNKFYESKQKPEQIKDKISKFDDKKKDVISKFTSQSKFKSDLKIINGIAADIDKDTLVALSADADVKKVELDREVKITLDTSLDQIRAKEVWNLQDSQNQALTGFGIDVAIIDTGVDYTHLDLGGCLGQDCKIIGGYDFVNNDNNPMDDHGHGTHVAATVAGKGLLNGVAPDARILAVKVLSAGGSGSWSQVIAGINFATDPNGDGDSSDHVDVANMSLGGSGNPDDVISLAVDNSTAMGVVHAIAAGNSGPGASTIGSPGAARTAITVAASCKGSQIGSNSYCTNPIASFSSRGPLVWNEVDIQKPDIAAPGVLICAARWGTSFGTAPTCFDDQHVRISGTSMATPHIAGVAALLKQAYPDYTPEQIKQTLKSTTRDIGMTYNDRGAGEVDVKAAIPFSSKILAAPSTWTLSSDPTQKLSEHTLSFSVSSTDELVTDLTVDLNLGIPGVGVTASKTTLDVSGGQTDVFDAVITVDNDIARAGNYFVRINLSENGAVKGNIPVFLRVSPTIATNPSGSLDYGVDSPALANWTSDTKTITLTNLRTDVEQTLTLTSSSYPTGITYESPVSVTVPANETGSIDTRFIVDNTSVSNNIYTGTLTFSNAANNISLTTKFTKFYLIKIQDNISPGLTVAWPVVIHNRAGKVYYDFTKTAERVFYVNDPGTYDVYVRYEFAHDSNNNFADAVVMKEGTSVDSGETIVNVNRSEAVNFVKTIPTDPSGSTGYIVGRDQILTYAPNPQAFTFGLNTFGGNPDIMATQYFSNISDSYTYERFHQSKQPEVNLYNYYYKFTGLSGNLNFTNNSSDFYKMDVQWDLDQQVGEIYPLVWTGSNRVGYHVYYSSSLPKPVFNSTKICRNVFRKAC